QVEEAPGNRLEAVALFLVAVTITPAWSMITPLSLSAISSKYAVPVVILNLQNLPDVGSGSLIAILVPTTGLVGSVLSTTISWPATTDSTVPSLLASTQLRSLRT